MSNGKSGSKLLTQIHKEPSQRSEYIAQTEEEEKNNNLHLEQEIECPRCHEMMTLCSNFDRLCYRCEECNFPLYLN